MTELALAAQARGADTRTARQCRKRGVADGDEDIPPTLVSEPWMRSPSVTIGNRFTVRPGWAVRRRSATCSACHRASGLFRVAMRTSRFMRHSAMLLKVIVGGASWA